MLRLSESHKTDGAWDPAILKPPLHFMKSPTCTICVKQRASLLSCSVFQSFFATVSKDSQWNGHPGTSIDISGYRLGPGLHVFMSFGGLHLSSTRAHILLQGNTTLHNDPRLICDLPTPMEHSMMNSEPRKCLSLVLLEFTWSC